MSPRSERGTSRILVLSFTAKPLSSVKTLDRDVNINVKLSRLYTQQHKYVWGKRDKLHACLTSVPHESESSASRSGHLTPLKEHPFRANWLRRWEDPRVILDKRAPARNRTRVIQPVASRVIGTSQPVRIKGRIHAFYCLNAVGSA